MKVSDLLNKGGAQAPKVGTMHSEIILDASGSMGGDKYNAAVAGIREELRELRKEESKVKTVVRIIEFEGSWAQQRTSCMKISGPADLYDVVFAPSGVGGTTPLYATIGHVLDTLKERMVAGDTAVVKIFTDGGDNASHGSPYAHASAIGERIKQAEAAGVVVTFVGTQVDVNSMIKNVGIHTGNTLVHDNTPGSITKAFKMSSDSTRSMRADYGIGGQNVVSTSNFYNNTDSKDQGKDKIQ